MLAIRFPDSFGPCSSAPPDHYVFFALVVDVSLFGSERAVPGIPRSSFTVFVSAGGAAGTRIDAATAVTELDPAGEPGLYAIAIPNAGARSSGEYVLVRVTHRGRTTHALAAYYQGRLLPQTAQPPDVPPPGAARDLLSKTRFECRCWRCWPEHGPVSRWVGEHSASGTP